MMAETYLKSNTKNRGVTKERIQRYAESMRKGEWTLSNDAIVFSDRGILMNGQHRLMAVVQSGEACQFLVVRGLKEETFVNMDIGKNRSAGDILSIQGVTNARLTASVIRTYYALREHLVSNLIGGDRCRLSNSDIKEMEENNRGLFRTATIEAKRIYEKNRVLRESFIGGCIAYLIKDKGHSLDEIVMFFSEICSVKESSFPTLELLRVRLLNDKISNTHLTSYVKQKLIMKAWNCFVGGRDLKVLKYVDETDKNLWFE